MTPNAKKILQIVGFSVFFILIIVYAFFISKDLIFGVRILNVNFNGQPAQSGAVFTENVLKITGNARNAINLTLNGREISVNEESNFDETIALLSGYNIIDITAKDKFGNIDEKDYQLMLLK